MAENMMFRTKDNYIVVMNNIRDAAHAGRLNVLIGSQTYDEIAKSTDKNIKDNLDVKNTEFVMKYVHRFDYSRRKEDFCNIFENAAENSRSFNTCGAPCLQGLNYDVKNAYVPKDVQALGYKIRPYDVEYEIGDDGNIIGSFSRTRAEVNSEERQIFIYRNHFKMSRETEAEMNRLITDFQSRSAYMTAAEYEATLSDGSKEKNLFSIYRYELENIQQKRLFLHHEFKHIKDFMHINTKLLNQSNYRLSATDNLLLSAEIEAQAFASMTMNARNEYLKRGDLNNFDVFSKTEDWWLVDKLKSLPEGERKKFLEPENIYVEARRHFFCADRAEKYVAKTTESIKKYLDRGDLDNFDSFDSTGDAWLIDKLKSLPISEREKFLEPKNFRNEVQKHLFTKNHSNYLKQFEDCAITNFVNNTAMNLPEDTGPFSLTFLMIRKQMSYFPFYDEKTKSYKMLNLEKYINDADGWTPEDEMVRKVQNAIDNRQAEYDHDVRNGANPALIEEARRFMRQRKKSAVVSADNTYIESLDADWIARHGIADDCADWSNNLQTYYKHLEGYTELAKNNEEYVFKLGNDVVRYTDPKNVAIGKESSFDTYMKVVNAPMARGSAINFRPNLNEEQKLMLFAACVASGRKMKGNIPTDLSGLDRLQGIDPAVMAKINRTLGRTPGTASFSSDSRPSGTYYRSTGRGGYGSR